MRSTILLATVLPVVLASSLPQCTPRSAEKGPPLRFTFTLDGVEYGAEEGQTFEVVRGEEKFAARIDVKPTRRFDAAGMAFDYPRHMSFEFEEGPGYRVWTLDGNDCTILVQRFPGLDFETMVRETIEIAASSLGVRSVAATPMELRLGDEIVEARRYKPAVHEFPETWILCTIEGEQTSSLLWLQDMPDDGEPTAEFETILELLGKTFEKKEK